MAEDSSMNAKELEILKFWKANKTFEKSLAKTKKGKPYIFYDGPPFATGLPHYGHLLGSILKDLFPRYFTMKGRYVKRVWGWDCHGLPIENVVEKKLGLNGKDEIEKIGVKKFNDACRTQVLEFAKDWETYIDRIGRWVDYAGGYKTMDTSYVESVWWAFKQFYEKGYLYEGEKVLMYCPRCSTPLAKSEITMDNSYRRVKDTSVVVKFASTDEEKTYFLAWTTTPWTLPSNLALAVHPNLDYVFVKDSKDGNTYILAKELLGAFYKSESEYSIEKQVKGKELEGMMYEPLFDYFGDNPNSFKVILGDFVTVVEGTGIVHIAPAFGEDDNLVAKKYNIPIVSPVDEKGRFTEAVKDYAFEFVHDANEKIVIDLKKSGKAIMSRKIEHDYPFCYRCDTKLIYRALPAWFVNIQKIKDKLLKLNLKINWYPEFLKEGIMKNNITSAPDWNITRNRYWASAIPIWRSPSGKIAVIGSIKELKKYAVKLPKEIDLHKDCLDDVELEIGKERYKRIPEVLDCWFESGSMTFAQFHYPFENKKFFEANFPAQFVVEYIAQTRTWFYYMIVLSAVLFDEIPFENVLTTGTILAEDGEKMSKSKGNYPDPLKVIEKYGADTLRFYLMQSPVVLAENVEFSEKGLEEVYKKVIILISNVKNFFGLYKNLKRGNLNSKNILDKWVISRTNELIRDVGGYLEGYNPIKACVVIKEFTEDLSTWYIRRSRDRFNEDDKDARAVLEYVLDNFSKVIAPIMPFMGEMIYQELYGTKESAHLQGWPKVDLKKIDEKLNLKMKMAREIVSLGLKERDKAGIPVKWPLAKATVYLKDNQVNELGDIIKDELNIKKLELKINSKSDEIKVELDTKITPDLESEGMAREISRKIQAMRKNAGLVKEDEISLFLDFGFNLRVEDQDFIKSRVGAKEICFGKASKNLSFFEEGQIKDKKYWVGFNKI